MRISTTTSSGRTQAKGGESSAFISHGESVVCGAAAFSLMVAGAAFAAAGALAGGGAAVLAERVT